MEQRESQHEITMSFVAPAATDEVLVAEAKLGCHIAFAELWTRHSNATFKMVCQITRNRDDAEDVIQEAWMKAYVHLKSFDGRAKFSTWLTRIAVNSALMNLRKKRNHPETPTDIVDGETWHSWEIANQMKSVEDLCVERENAWHLKHAISRLNPALRNVIEIYQANDRSLGEVAELAGITVAATKSRLSRAKKVLRGTLSSTNTRTSHTKKWGCARRRTEKTYPVQTLDRSLREGPDVQR
jgi:RNA polymerase sigma-70 factor, ECF subfamily